MHVTVLKVACRSNAANTACRGSAVKQHTYNEEVAEVSCRSCRGSDVKQHTCNAEVAEYHAEVVLYKQHTYNVEVAEVSCR
jgi:hypothetical protein